MVSLVSFVTDMEWYLNVFNWFQQQILDNFTALIKLKIKLKLLRNCWPDQLATGWETVYRFGCDFENRHAPLLCLVCSLPLVSPTGWGSTGWTPTSWYPTVWYPTGWQPTGWTQEHAVSQRKFSSTAQCRTWNFCCGVGAQPVGWRLETAEHSAGLEIACSGVGAQPVGWRLETAEPPGADTHACCLQSPVCR